MPSQKKLLLFYIPGGNFSDEKKKEHIETMRFDDDFISPGENIEAIHQFSGHFSTDNVSRLSDSVLEGLERICEGKNPGDCTPDDMNVHEYMKQLASVVVNRMEWDFPDITPGKRPREGASFSLFSFESSKLPLFSTSTGVERGTEKYVLLIETGCAETSMPSSGKCIFFPMKRVIDLLCPANAQKVVTYQQNFLFRNHQGVNYSVISDGKYNEYLSSVSIASVVSGLVPFTLSKIEKAIADSPCISMFRMQPTGNSLLALTCQDPDMLEISMYLLTKGANPVTKNHEGLSAIDYCMRNASVPLISYMAAHPLWKHSVPKCIFSILDAPDNKNTELLLLFLLGNGVHLDQIDPRSGKSLLKLSTEKNNLHLFKIILFSALRDKKMLPCDVNGVVEFARAKGFEGIIKNIENVNAG
jgi:hypothetical protein